jgi:hypothetical protein
VEVVKENGAQPGCPACGFGWQTAPKIEPWPEVSPWEVVPYYPPYIPDQTYPGGVTYPWYKFEWVITSDGTTNMYDRVETNPTVTSTTGFKYGIEENKPS